MRVSHIDGTAATSSAPHRLGLGIYVILLVFTLASALGTNPYTFGTSANSFTIAYAKAAAHPGLYPDDYLVAQRTFYYTFLWNTLGILHARLGISLAILFLGTYLTAIYLTFYAMYRIAMTLFERIEIAMLALLFLLFLKFALGDVRTIEQILTTQAVATPLQLLAVHAFLTSHRVRAFLLLGLAYLIHPLTTHYALAMLFVASVADIRRCGIKPLLLGMLVFLAAASPVLVWRLRHAPGALQLFSADPEWLVALHQRSAHHVFPSSWGWEALAHTAVVLSLFAIAWRHRNPEAEDRHRTMGIATLTVLGLCVFGVVGSELHPMGLTFLLQPMRSFQFIEFFAMLYVAHYLYRGMEKAERLASALLVAAVAGWVVYGGMRLVVPMAVVLAVSGLIWVRQWVMHRPLRGTSFVLAVTTLACIAAFACWAHDRSAGYTTFSPRNVQEPLWRDVQRWAREHTDIHDGFITSPGMRDGFRVESERTIYGEFRDGVLMNPNPEFGHEWLRRMRALGFGPETRKPDFCRLTSEQLEAVVREMKLTHPRVFLVWPCAGRPLPYPETYRNALYVVYQVG